jgi:alpha-1,3-rhamnosyl/mannosyltransferase
VAQLYHGAEAVVLPSQFEGFGLPVLEAVAFGRRVITSRLAVFDEVGLPAANQIDFTQPDQLLEAMRLPVPTVLTHPPQTWDDCARATLEVLRGMGHRGAGQGVPKCISCWTNTCL